MENSEAICTICLNVLDSKEELLATTNSCHHSFHLNCIREWSQRSLTCANCRTVFLGMVLEGTGETIVNLKARCIRLAVQDMCFEKVNRMCLYFRIFYMHNKELTRLNKGPVANRTRRSPAACNMMYLRLAFDTRMDIPDNLLEAQFIGRWNYESWRRKVLVLIDNYTDQFLVAGNSDIDHIARRINDDCGIAAEFIDEIMEDWPNNEDLRYTFGPFKKD